MKSGDNVPVNQKNTTLMKLNTLIRSAFIGAALTASSLFANTVVIDTTAYSYGSGGEFLAQTSNNGDFLTFCLEKDVFFSEGVQYYYDIHENTVLSANDVISKGTAYLFSNFSKGTLGGYFGPDRLANAGLLQKAIWMLEGDLTYDNSNPYIALVEGIFGANATSNVGSSSVKVMNVWNNYNPQTGTYSGDKQSMLIRVPDSGMTALLLGLGLLSLAAFRRKL